MDNPAAIPFETDCAGTHDKTTSRRLARTFRGHRGMLVSFPLKPAHPIPT